MDQCEICTGVENVNHTLCDECTEKMESDKNCWDCGINVVEEEDGGYMCTDCHRTLCWDCKGGRLAAFRDPHHYGREEDKGACGKTTRIL